MAEAVRRVVLGVDAEGRSQLQADARSPHVFEVPRMAGLTLTDLWYTDDAPASLAGEDDAADRPLSVAPTPTGSLFRIVEFPPDTDLVAAGSEGSHGAASLGLDEDQAGGGSDDGLVWHQTASVDFNVVLSGRLALLHDGGRIDLEAGDAVIVRGVRHAWSNPGDGPARLAAVAVGAAKPAEGH